MNEHKLNSFFSQSSYDELGISEERLFYTLYSEYYSDETDHASYSRLSPDYGSLAEVYDQMFQLIYEESYLFEKRIRFWIDRNAEELLHVIEAEKDDHDEWKIKYIK